MLERKGKKRELEGKERNKLRRNDSGGKEWMGKGKEGKSFNTNHFCQVSCWGSLIFRSTRFLPEIAFFDSCFWRENINQKSFDLQLLIASVSNVYPTADIFFPVRISCATFFTVVSKKYFTCFPFTPYFPFSRKSNSSEV